MHHFISFLQFSVLLPSYLTTVILVYVIIINLVKSVLGGCKQFFLGGREFFLSLFFFDGGGDKNWGQTKLDTHNVTHAQSHMLGFGTKSCEEQTGTQTGLYI